MKKIIIQALIFMIPLGVLAVQPKYFDANGRSSRDNFLFGLSGGAVVSNIKNSVDVGGCKTNSKLGYSFGAIVDLSIYKGFGVSSGVNLTNLGMQYDISGGNIVYNANYIQVPLTFRYRFKLQDNTYLYPSFGAYYGYGVGGEVKKIEYGYGSTKENYFLDSKNKVDYGATGGVNFRYNRIIVNVSYYYGLGKINKSSTSGKNDELNEWVQLSVGYFF